MQKPENKYDEVLQGFIRKWMKTLDKPRFTTQISYFFIALFSLLWATTITKLLGYTPMQNLGVIITPGIIFVFILIYRVMNNFLSMTGISWHIRSALWFSWLFGPYLSIIALNNWENPALSHIIGVFSSIFAFLLSYSLDRMFDRRSVQQSE